MTSVVKTESNLAAFTFFAKSLGTGEVCGSNGLPVLPYSISILGRSQYLKSLKHPNLCEFLETLRGKHERTVVVSEYRGTPLNEMFRKLKQDDILRVFYQTIDGGCIFFYILYTPCFNNKFFSHSSQLHGRP